MENNVILVRNERLTVDPDSPRNPHICDPVDIDESESVQSDRHARANAGFFLPRRKRTKQNNDLSNSEPYVDEGESPNVEYKDQQQKMVDSDTDQKIKILVPVRRERPSRIQRKGIYLEEHF